MNWTVTIRAQAQHDLAHARDWYEQQRKGLGNEFLLAVADAMLAVEDSPESRPLYYRGFRRILLDRFPYKVFYQIEADTVIVFRVLHAAQDHPRELI